MKIFALRHGFTEYNKLGKTNGQTIEDPLTEEGIEQAQKIVWPLSSKVDIIFTSDLLRARHTADIINVHLKAEVIATPALREIHLGSLTGLSWKEMNEKVGRDILGEYKAQQYDFKPWGGESFEEMKARIVKLLDEIKEKYSDKTILLVTHGGVIRTLHFLCNNKVGQKAPENLEIVEFEI